MIRLPSHINKDRLIQAGLQVPFTLLVNHLLFGYRYFNELNVFLWATAVTSLVMAISWECHTRVGVILRIRFYRDRDIIRRLVIANVLFLIITGITLAIIFWGYDYLRFFDYDLDESKYDLALGCGTIVNVFVSVVQEGLYSFEKWKMTLIETEQLKKEYMQSQLLGLRSQVSPHFLFNSLNSLSSLISDQPEEAETFLNEMSKVYRYLLRSNEEQTVDVERELEFLRSYYHQLKTRYGSAVELNVNVASTYRRKLLPPLTMQLLLDNIFKINMISKQKPLKIDIYVSDDEWLEIRNNIQPRISDDTLMEETGLANISNKFRLLCQHSIQIIENASHRIIKVPLINAEQITLT
jgi:two-component system LytT family sensor kinase